MARKPAPRTRPPAREQEREHAALKDAHDALTLVIVKSAGLARYLERFKAIDPSRLFLRDRQHETDRELVARLLRSQSKSEVIEWNNVGGLPPSGWPEHLGGYTQTYCEWVGAIDTAERNIIGAAPWTEREGDATVMRWTSIVRTELEKLLACFHPSLLGENGLGVIARPIAVPELFQVLLQRLHHRRIQLATMLKHRAAASKSPSVPEEYWPASSFPVGMPTVLRKAAAPNRKSKRVRSMEIDGVVCYHVGDARQWYGPRMAKA